MHTEYVRCDACTIPDSEDLACAIPPYPFPSESPTPEPTRSPTPAPTGDYTHGQPNDKTIEFTRTWSDLGVAPAGTQLNDKTIEYGDYDTPKITDFMRQSIVFKKAYPAAPESSTSRLRC